MTRLTPEETDAKRKRQFNEVVKAVAEKVGHGAATLKKHYLLPEIQINWIEKGKVIDLSKFKPTEMQFGGTVKTEKQKKKVAKVMGEFKEGDLKTSHGKKVTDRKQAVAIALSEAERMDEKPDKLIYGGELPFEGWIDDSRYDWKVNMDDCYQFYVNKEKKELKEIIDHHVLFKKLPNLKKVKVVFGNITNKETDADSYIICKDNNTTNCQIFINLDFDYYYENKKEKYSLESKYPEYSKEAVLLHEIQHLGQHSVGKEIGRGYESIREEVNRRGAVLDIDLTPDLLDSLTIQKYKKQLPEQEAMKTVFLWLRSKGLKYFFDDYINWDYEKNKSQSESQEGLYKKGGKIKTSGWFSEESGLSFLNW